jgi:hypothetical protein
MHPKPSDDPHDFVVVAPEAARVAPSDDELSNLLHKAARYRSYPQNLAVADLPAGPTVPPVDTTFRPAAIDDIWPSSDRPPSHRRSTGRGVLRAVTALLLTALIGGAAVAWRSYGDGAEKKIAKWTTQFVMAVSQPTETPVAAAQAAPPAVQADAANAASPQPAPAPLEQTPPEGAAPTEQIPPAGAAPTAAALSPESEQLLQSMARDLASVGQEVAQLKASIEQLKDSQQQMSRDVAKASSEVAKASSEVAKASEKASSEAKASEAKASEQKNLRPRRSAPPPRSAAAPARKPIPPYPAAQAAARTQAGAPYYGPRQPDYAPRQLQPQPQVLAEPQADRESESVPRPPMPLR